MSAELTPVKDRARSYEPEEWIKAITRQIRKALKNRFYGVLRIEFYDGRVVRGTLERSIINPRALAPGEDDRI